MEDQTRPQVAPGKVESELLYEVCSHPEADLDSLPIAKLERGLGLWRVCYPKVDLRER